MKLLHSLLSIAALSLPLASTAQIKLVENHLPQSRIIVTTSQESDSVAATILQDFINRSTKVKLPVYFHQSHPTIKKGDVLIGNGMSNASLVTDELKEDGFRIHTKDGFLRVVSGGDSGSVYAITSILERYMDVRYWGKNEYTVKPMADVVVPSIDWVDNPAFIHRQTAFYGQEDPMYKWFSRLESVDELFVNRLWVHTFNRLIPAAVYGEAHPEYYAYYNGKRHPGAASQWCLTNPAVLELAIQKLDSIFKTNPKTSMISVSQNDGNFSWCQCDACKALMEKEGSISGPYIHFMNKLAERFPDKQISTLAYIFTVAPPKHVKPLPNVNIMLCNIGCAREVPLDENESGKTFVKDLEKWSAMTDNFFLWDYGINFDNQISPFPNYHVLAPNMRIFRKNHVPMVFLQTSGNVSDFAEMRTWIASKLMWNPYADTDVLMKEFMNGYYGEKAAPFLYKYITLMEGALLGTDATLLINHTPIAHKDGMFNPKLMKRYNQLFDEAEKAAANDSTYLARIQRSRMSIMFAELEILRSNVGHDVNVLAEKLDKFECYAKRFGLKRTGNDCDAETYCKSYRERYLVNTTGNLALGAKVTYVIKPAEKFAKLGETALTDGLFGGDSFNESWVGWEASDASFVIDLGEEKEVSSIEADILERHRKWILLPKQVTYSVSNDGKEFTEAGTYVLGSKPKVSTLYTKVKHTFTAKQKVRYIRVDVEAEKICPSWHAGVGNPCWFFIDEVTVM